MAEIDIQPEEAAALHRLLEAYCVTEHGDPGLPALSRLRDRICTMPQDHQAYEKYFDGRKERS